MTFSTSRSIFWRLFWKEYRVQRAFWLCLAILAVLLMALPAVTVANGGDRLYWRFAIARVLPALFAAACGAMLFATEHEAGTYEFQRSLPLSPGQLLLGKCAFALCSVAALYAVCWLSAMLLSGIPLGEAFASLPAWAPAVLPGRSVHVALLDSPFFALELFLWPVLFSLLLRQPLSAAIAGAVAAEITVDYITWHVSPTDYYRAAMPWRLAIASILAAADVWLGLRWLEERGGAAPLGGPRRRSSTVASAAPRTRSAGHSIARLIWEFWRQPGGRMLAIGTLLLPLLLLLFWFNVRPGYQGDFEMCSEILIMLMLATFAVFPLVGTLAFLGDQRGCGYRFLADRGVRPGHVWLSRQLPVWIGSALLVAVLSALATKFGLLWAGHSRWRDAAFVEQVANNVALTAVSLAILGVAAGQLCSMLFRNGFIAAFFAILLTAVFGLWYGLMWLWGVNWLWSVLPIPLDLLLATRLRTPHWLVEHNTPGAWLPTGLALLVPAAAILTAVPLYRAYEIPAVGPGFPLEEYDRPPTASEMAVNDLYQQALDHYVSFETFCKRNKRPYANEDELLWYKRRPLTPDLIAWIDASQMAIDKSLVASRSNESVPFSRDRTERGLNDGDVWRLARLVVFSAVGLEQQGKLDAAMDRYFAAIRISVQLRRCADAHWSPADDIEHKVYSQLPSWAARPRQTPERIVAAARKIHDLTAHLPPDTEVVKLDYLRVRHALLGGYDAIIKTYGVNGGEALMPLTYIWSQLPWERTRAVRLLDVLTRRQLDQLTKDQAATERGETVEQPGYEIHFEPRELPYALRKEVYVPPIYGAPAYEQEGRIHHYVDMVAFRRGVRLSLLLEAWKLRHGALPKSLDELVGPELDHVPIDPFTGMPFRFVRAGVGISLRWRLHELNLGASGEIGAHVPFVWSAGPRVRYSPLLDRPGDLSLDRYEITDNLWYEHPWSIPGSDYDLWQAGLPVPVP